MRQASVSAALAKALRAADVPDSRAVLAALAKRYAAALDERPEDLPKLGPQLLGVLQALGLTGVAAAVAGGEAAGGDRAAATLDELRARRRRRAGPG